MAENASMTRQQPVATTTANAKPAVTAANASSSLLHTNNTDADIAAGTILSFGKQEMSQQQQQGENKMFKTDEAIMPPPPTNPNLPITTTAASLQSTPKYAPIKASSTGKKREIRLQQNRKAACESRKRKKIMIEELQRSVIFFSRANGALKQQNDALEGLLAQAQSQIAGETSGEQQQQAMYSGGYTTNAAPTVNAAASTNSMSNVNNNDTNASSGNTSANNNQQQQLQQQDQSNGTPFQLLAQMQPGATMQAMANFQQVAAQAMQQAMGTVPYAMQASANNVAVANMNNSNAYTDTLTAFAMHQAAAAAPYMMQHPAAAMFMNPLMWQQMQAQQQLLAQQAMQQQQQASIMGQQQQQQQPQQQMPTMSQQQQPQQQMPTMSQPQQQISTMNQQQHQQMMNSNQSIANQQQQPHQQVNNNAAATSRLSVPDPLPNPLNTSHDSHDV